ncbi:MAG: SDR family NAD(P)-dependent oxidoreductase [Acidimicrobiia bacterium]|nr:SDR family NAD(P)-dependent oxidoreductase [Acidimicrobiia bacterium]
MTVAVTGASGHLGANLVRALLAQGREVRAVTAEPLERTPPALAGLPVERVQADVRDLVSVERALRGADVVYNLAGRISVVNWDRKLLQEINVTGVANVAQACLRNGVGRLVQVSSVHALSPFPTGVPVDEQRPLVSGRSVPVYDRTKAAGEREVRAAGERGLDVVIVRPTGIIGPTDFAPSRMGRTFLDVWHRRMLGSVGGGCDWVDVRDVVAGAMAAAALAPSGSSYLLGGAWASMAELMGLAAEVAGVRRPPLRTPMTIARTLAPAAAAWSRVRGSDARLTSNALRALRVYRQVSHERAAQELGYTPRPLIETLTDTYRWFAARGALPAEDAAPVAHLASA